MTGKPDIKYICDGEGRHLVCYPYSVENLHAMAAALGIKRCWYHASSRFKHYDIPKRRIAEISGKCTVLPTKMLLQIIKGYTLVTD